MNECDLESKGSCTQRCRNLDGSYECYCQIGYELGPDGYTCLGKLAKNPS